MVHRATVEGWRWCVGSRSFSRMLLGAALVLLCAVPVEAADLATLARVTGEAGPKIDRLRKAKPDSPEAKKTIREIFEDLRPFAKAVRKMLWKHENRASKVHAGFAHRFNELLTLARLHKVKLREKYICWSRTLARKRLRVAIPVTRYWKLKYKKEDQLTAVITQSRPSGKPLREIKVWRYKWNTVYSGVGGENYKKLAEQIHELDWAEAIAAGGKASRLRVKKLNREFSRVYYYTVELHDSELKANVRRREYYAKGKSATFNFAITDFWEVAGDDDELTRFQVKGEGVELMHLLQSLSLND